MSDSDDPDIPHTAVHLHSASNNSHPPHPTLHKKTSHTNSLTCPRNVNGSTIHSTTTSVTNSTSVTTATPILTPTPFTTTTTTTTPTTTPTPTTITTSTATATKNNSKKLNSPRTTTKSTSNTINKEKTKRERTKNKKSSRDDTSDEDIITVLPSLLTITATSKQLKPMSNGVSSKETLPVVKELPLRKQSSLSHKNGGESNATSSPSTSEDDDDHAVTKSTLIPFKGKKSKSTNKLKESGGSSGGVPSDEFIEHEITAINDFMKKEGPSIEVDGRDLVAQFTKAFSEVSHNLLKPNVLITGITGAGKSSLINAIFGQSVAETGTGVPLTQHYTKYESEDMRVVIYDSKGLEHGQFEEFIRSTNEFFDTHKPGTVGEADNIHVIWYIINSAHSRWEPFEERICRELLNRAPLMFVLNKTDISSAKDRRGMRKLIDQMNLPNAAGIFETIAYSSNKLKNFDVCPNCNSDDLILKTKIATMICQECKHTESLIQTNGLNDLIQSTCSALPDVLRGAFISAQNVNFYLKEQHCCEILEQFWAAFTQVRTQAKLFKIIAEMMARLSIVWEFKKRGQQYGNFMARDLVSAFTWKEKLNLLFQNKIEVQRKHTTALGILWNRCLREFAIELFKCWSKSTESSQNINCSVLFKKIFSQMNEKNLLAVEDAITNQGLKGVLEEEKKRLDDAHLDTYE